MKKKIKLICLTPIRNESWILERFLKCTSMWADYIILGDQGSTDTSRKIASKFPKVRVINNPRQERIDTKDMSHDYRMRRPLFEEAKKIPGKKLFLALDADEVLSANFMNSSEWKMLISASPGTIVNFKWVNITPDLQTYWSPDNWLKKGFMDDGTEFKQSPVETLVVPNPENAKNMYLDKIKLIHYQYTDWARMESKHRWYQCWEKINNLSRGATNIYRQYHHMDSIPKNRMFKLEEEWFLGYTEKGINMKIVTKERIYWWDKEVSRYLKKYGCKFFSKIDVWNGKNSFNDPRSFVEKLFHVWLKVSQPYTNRTIVQYVDKILSKFGW